MNAKGNLKFCFSSPLEDKRTSFYFCYLRYYTPLESNQSVVGQKRNSFSFISILVPLSQLSPSKILNFPKFRISVVCSPKAKHKLNIHENRRTCYHRYFQLLINSKFSCLKLLLIIIIDGFYRAPSIPKTAAANTYDHERAFL